MMCAFLHSLPCDRLHVVIKFLNELLQKYRGTELCFWGIIFRNDRRVHRFILCQHLYDVPAGFVTPLFWGCVLLYLRSPKGGCCSISDDMSCIVLQSVCIVNNISVVPCLFDYTAVAVSGKVGAHKTTPVGWLLLPQLTVLSRYAIVV